MSCKINFYENKMSEEAKIKGIIYLPAIVARTDISVSSLIFVISFSVRCSAMSFTAVLQIS